jgi:mRNA-degrading endonuclease toxin of MazEF toxin-antitoxin module
MTTSSTTATAPGARARTQSRRPLLPLANLALAGAALAVGVVAITTDDTTAPVNVATPRDESPAPPLSPSQAATGAVRGPTPAGDCLTRAIVVRC